MMGHVDHGKTSLLDAIRKTDVAAGEAGGITQHIGAYRAKTKAGVFTFIDTPGHEAFTAMRARGANVTDIVVLVVAADDGVMPQTVEAINHARAAEVPIMVALNKCDLPGADPERTRRMLMEHNLVPEELGGETIICEVSAKTGKGLDRLLEMLTLQGEMLEVDANPNKPGRGVVLEAYLDRGRGPVANVMVQDGTLKLGDVLVAGTAYGKIRAITDDRGHKLKEAGPSTPVEVLGLSSVPQAGNPFDAVVDMKVAEKVGSSRAEKQRASSGGASRPSLETLYEQMQNTEQVELKIIIKSDVQGTTEALVEAMQKLSTAKVKVTIIHASVGGITESDVLLASTSGAIIIGFNVRPAGKAKNMASEQNVEIRLFSIIYEVIDEMKKAMVGLLEPTKQEEILGQVEVRDTFTVPKVGTVAGSYVTEGKVVRNARARLIRDSVQIWEGKVGSLRRFKDDVKEVQTGFECGISLDGYNDIKIKDIIEIYTEKEIEATLA
jgi:translation initiation factor IF-2